MSERGNSVVFGRVRPLRWFVSAGLVVLFSVPLIGCSEPVSVPDMPKTGDPVWDQYAHARARFYRRLHQFGTDRWPDLEPLFDTQHEYHIANLRLRSLQFQHLLENHPERIVRDRGLPEFVNFRWTDTDTRQLRRKNERYRTLQEQVKNLREHTFDHPDWPLARRRIRALPNDSRYHEILNQFRQTRSRLSNELSSGP